MSLLCRLTRLQALVLTGFALCVSAAAQAPEPQGSAGETLTETVNVEIKLVPFYAVDEDGKPVYDLKQDEIEVRIDGKPVAIDTFDAFPKGGGATTISNAGAETPAPVPVPAKAAAEKHARRHVVLFFDVAFASHRGFESGRKFAEKMVKELPAADLLYLVTFDFQAGLKQRLGPLAANAEGKAQILAGVKKIKPEAGHLDDYGTWGNLPLVSRGKEWKNGVPPDQNSALDNAVRTNSQAQLEGTARTLAESMQVIADQFQRINEPKLMVFLSQGISPTLYWEGSDVGLQFSSAAHGSLFDELPVPRPAHALPEAHGADRRHRDHEPLRQPRRPGGRDGERHLHAAHGPSQRRPLPGRSRSLAGDRALRQLHLGLL